MTFAVAVEGLSKSYRVGGPADAPQETMLGQLGASITAPFRHLLESGRKEPREAIHWALRGVSFQVQEGEALGIIGHNGAGKSTLLKILSRITHPTAGVARVRGRMASLLEVGTGFHPDLTGRDNVIMNAAILGLSRREIATRFGAIIEFAGVEEYIDTPIKHYSSGMKVRLAFAVAAHLDPDILVIDEILAVGDAAFQKRCINRVEEVGAGGRTILFVSHQLTTVARLCTRTIVLDHGRIAFDGPTLEALRYYNDRLGGARTLREWADPAQAPGDAVARLRSVELLAGDSPAAGPIDVRQRVGVRVRYRVEQAGAAVTPSVHLFDGSGNWIFASIDLHSGWHARPRTAGDYESTAWIPPNLLNEAAYVVSVGLARLDPYRAHCFAHDCVAFAVFDPKQGDTARGVYGGEIPGLLRPMLDWETRHV